MSDMDRAEELSLKLLQASTKNHEWIIAKALTEAHERGRKEGLEKAIQTILAEARFQEDQRSLKESIVLRNVAESIRTAMEGK